MDALIIIRHTAKVRFPPGVRHHFLVMALAPETPSNFGTGVLQFVGAGHFQRAPSKHEATGHWYHPQQLFFTNLAMFRAGAGPGPARSRASPLRLYSMYYSFVDPGQPKAAHILPSQLAISSFSTCSPFKPFPLLISKILTCQSKMPADKHVSGSSASHRPPVGFEPIKAPDDFFAKSIEFRHWLKEEKHKTIDQIDSGKAKSWVYFYSSLSTRPPIFTPWKLFCWLNKTFFLLWVFWNRYFSKFARYWNKGKLKAEYYERTHRVFMMKWCFQLQKVIGLIDERVAFVIDVQFIALAWGDLPLDVPMSLWIPGYEVPEDVRASTSTSSSHAWSFQGLSALEKEKVQAARQEAFAGPSLPPPSSHTLKPLIGPSLPPQAPSSPSTTLSEFQYKRELEDEISKEDIARKKAELKRKRYDEKEEDRSNRATGKDRLLEKRKEKREDNNRYQQDREDRTAVELDDRSMFGAENSFQAAWVYDRFLLWQVLSAYLAGD